MISKIFFTTILLVTSAQRYGYRNNGHSISSQPANRQVSYKHRGYYSHAPPIYQGPVSIHATPVINHIPIGPYIPPIPHHDAPITYNAHQIPPTHHLTPLTHHVASVFHNIGPFSHYVSPAPYHLTHTHPTSSNLYHSSPNAQIPNFAINHIATTSNYASPVLPLQYSNDYSQHPYAHDHQDYYTHPKYEFEYNIADIHTGDIKSQHETPDGDHVTGFYRLHEPDGSIRTVHYTVEKHSGFDAHVEQSGHSTRAHPTLQYAPQYPLSHQ